MVSKSVGLVDELYRWYGGGSSGGGYSIDG